MILFINRCTADHATARQSLDMLMMAVTLEQDAAALFTGAGLQQLVKPDAAQNADPMKKIAMLEDLFEFKAFYVIDQELDQSRLSEKQLRVAVNVIDEKQAAALQADAKHVIRF